MAVSRHPVPATATGETVGECIEALATRPDLVIVAARPGHRGALEDVTAAVRRLLGADVVLGMVSEVIGTRSVLVDRGPGLALWAGAVGRVRPLFEWDAAGGPPRLVLTHPSPTGPTVAVDLDGQVWAGAPSSVVGGAEVDSDWALATIDGLADVGPPMRVTDAGGVTVRTLDGRPAIEAVTAVARQHLPADDLRRLSPELRLRAATGVPWHLQGVDAATGAVVGGPGAAPDPGTTVVLSVPQEGAAAAALGRATARWAARHGDRGGGALVVAPAGRAADLVGGPPPGVGAELWAAVGGPVPDPPTSPGLPTLVVEAAGAHRVRDQRPGSPDLLTRVALFPPSPFASLPPPPPPPSPLPAGDG